LSTERLCTGKEGRCTLLPFHPLLGYPAVETESGRCHAHNTQQTTRRINKPIDTHSMYQQQCCKIEKKG